MSRCPSCGETFDAVVPHQKYCSAGCRVKAFRRRAADSSATRPRARPRSAKVSAKAKTVGPIPRSEEAGTFEDGIPLLKAFSRAIPDIAFVIDEDGLYVEVLAAPEREDLLYREAEALKGRTLHEVLPKGRADLFLSVIRETIETREPQILEYSLDVQAGRMWFEGRSAPLDFPGGKRMAVWIAHDITEKKRTERIIRRERARLAATLESSSSTPDPHGLTIRERAVLQLLADGKSDKEIASILDIRSRTVGKHVENLLVKMGAASRLEAGVRAVRDGLVE
jgi:PAS domain S-box-containing protein